MEPKKYLLFVTLPYAYSILRPLEHEIRRRGDSAAWFIEADCPVALEEGEVHLKTIREAVDYNPVAVFAPGNYIPDFFPGVKVALFHGYAIQKRIEAIDDHFTVRGWFDIYCTQGPSSTPYFKELERQYGFFRVYETGWPKADTYFSPETQLRPRNDRPVILYPPTFTRNVCSAPHLMKEIELLAKTKPWDWIITFHPKLTDPDIIAGYKRIAAENDNVTFFEGPDKMPLLQRADAMLCDSSSIILEFMVLDKPVVTFRNSHPGPHLIDVDRPEKVGPALERALSRPEELMREIRAYTMHHEPHRDCRCSARVLDAVDDYIARGHAGLKRKPLNLIRKWKLRRQMRYYPLLDEQGRYIGMFSQRNLLDLERPSVILVDHNERDQAADGIRSTNIIEIIDHHRIDSVET